MAQVMEHVDYLSREIGARTAGTEEERQAALYITDEFQSDSGFHTEIEDFVSSSNLELVRPLCCIVMFAVSILALLFPILCIPALILGLLASAVYTTELLGRPLVPRSLARGMSQNVVAKYQPNPDQGGRNKRTRKIVLVARYDTGSVRSGLDRMVRSLHLPVAWISIGTMALAAILLLIRTLFMANATGVGALIFNIINIVVIIIAAIPAVIAFLNRRAGLNEGANNNATGVAALLEVARRISRGSLSEADLSESSARMHGEQALRDEGLVPEGAQMVYESEQLLPPDLEPQTPEARLAKAKAALAAFTGVPGARWEPTDIANNLVDTRHGFVQPPAYEAGPIQDEEPVQATHEYESGYAAESDDIARDAFAAFDVQEEADSAPIAEQPDYQVEEMESSVVADGEAAAPASNIVEWDSISERVDRDDAHEDTGVSERFTNAPDWFVAAQKKARKSDSSSEVRPSRYGMAIAAVEDEIRRRAQEEEKAAAELERERLRESVAASKAQAEAEAAAAQAEVEEEVVDDFEPQGGFEAPEPVADTYVPIAVAAMDRDELRADMYHNPAEPEIPDEDARYAPVEAWSEGSSWKPEIELPELADEPVSGEEDEIVLADEVVDELLSAPRRRPIVLPSIEGAGLGTDAVDVSTPRDGLSGLPAIEGASVEDDVEALLPSRSGMIRRLRTDIPSLSGVISKVGSDADDEQRDEVPIGKAGASGTFAAVEEGLFAEEGSDDIYVDDVDDSELEENYTETGAYAGPGYVEMPKSRFGRLFGRKKNREERRAVPESAQEWLDVDEDFDARQVGKARGDWESFRPDDYDQLPQDQPKERMRDLLHDDEEAYADDFGAYSDGFDDDWGDDWNDGSAGRPRGGRRWQGGAFSRIRLGRIGARSDGAQDEDVETDRALPESPELSSEMAPIEQIYHFRNPNFNTEVWFVAIGSDTRRHDGIKAFVEEHRADLRGALMLEVESLGAGELCVIQEEGLFKRQTASSRIRRLLKKTASAVGFEPGQATIANADSLTSVAVGMGVQTMHLSGMEGEWPALKGSAGDTAENIDEELLLTNIDYITELVQRF